MGLLNFFSKINLATGGKNPNDATFAGLAALGLQIKQQDMRGVELEGVFNGRPAAMVVDGSAVMGAAGAAMAVGAASEIAGALGMISSSHGKWHQRQAELHSRSWVQRAQMVVRWAVVASAPARGPLEIGRTSETGAAIAPGLFATGDPALVAVLQNPQLLPKLRAAPFDVVSLVGNSATALWAPPMSEYGKVMSSSENIAKVAQDVLNALSWVVYLACEGGR